MTNACLVDVLDSSDQLLKNAYRRFLMQALLLDDVVEKFTIDAVLHYQIQLSFCFNYL
jgi:hypothetical protein